MPSVLEQIGFVPTEVPAADMGGLTREGAPAGAAPMAEAKQPAQLASAKDFADTLVAGAIMMLDQTVGFYGASSDEGRAVISAIRKLETVVPKEKLDSVKSQLASVATSIGPGAPGGLTGPMPTSPRGPTPGGPGPMPIPGL